MVQTPQQRKANIAFARTQEKKMGRAPSDTPVVAKKEKVQKAPISAGWLYLLLFVVCGGLVFELVRLILSGAGGLF
ncbi:unnamed protein product [Zymoseptoria tritici ST99CH_1A5]|uniref:Stress-associated endoplasmic reticulum protein n=4 Tax=Zymoseptoria tritici TaxID=1047171 RepID=F9XFY8_ZYMTI|nr:uncharacterized protein MYCGRDRAFT_81614 [Zymoseptoria tritici IPO323]SMQ52550.1 unnamed protein product [Zymoseptoria tritici ST99CH_3D7]SMR55374.1 unnamed protein product [Zymoseptoria tritici ST99CH_1E4]SMR57750.1 unnamed protein product [Zymoseptoria tritici ST99CH_3D1]SMY26186.1 unnamed protein product [Zymoseptoria tritici ST99CH_1A5]EGP86095.1 hypothetical protein MYCGRDRAFT_81614 [Zymoseptoria tritici IPO323]